MCVLNVWYNKQSEQSLRTEEFTMAEINKLSVGKVLDKIRSNDAKNSTNVERLDDKLKTIGEEMQRLRAQRNRLKRGPRAGTTERE